MGKTDETRGQMSLLHNHAVAFAISGVRAKY